MHAMRDKVHHAWDNSSACSSFEYCSEDTEPEERAEALQGACLLGLAAPAVALALFAGHAAGAEHTLFWVCDACVAAVFVGYCVLRFCNILGPSSMVPVCAGMAWALCLLISLGAPSRRRQMLGLEGAGGPEPCEEGSAVLWIALLLATLPVLAPMPAVPFALFGQFVTVQHLCIGLILPRPECSIDAGGPGGALLGLPPIWASSLQLSAMAALLVAGQWHLEKQRSAEKLIADYLSGHIRRPSLDYEDKMQLELAQNRLERIVNEIEKEEQDCRQLLYELDGVLPGNAQTARVWALLARHLTGILRRCSAQIKRYTYDGDNAGDQLLRAIEGSPQKQDAANAMAVSGWLEHSYSPRNFGNRHRRSSIARQNSELPELGSLEPGDHQEYRPMVRTKTVVGLSSDLRIGEWDFDALKCESEQHNILQVVGFELLRVYSLLPRMQLGAFLAKLEGSYIGGNPYHSHIHGADMTNAFYFLAVRTELWQVADFADSTRAAAIIAGLGHDVGHFAFNNMYLISSRHQLAITYNDRSVLENFHASTLCRILDEEYGELPDDRKKLLALLSAEHLQKARQLIITLILGTDPAKHLDDLSAFRMRMGASTFDPVGDANDQQQCLGMLFRAADIGHSAKEWSLHQEWSNRVVQEFHAQGDEEKRAGLKVSPLCDRENFQLANSQVGFLQFICLPTWKELVNLENKVKDLTKPILQSRSMRSNSGTPGRRSRSNSPRRTAVEQRRGSMGSPLPSSSRSPASARSVGGQVLQMVNGAAHRGSKHLMLPGSMPPGSGSPHGTKVLPAESVQFFSEDLVSSPIRWLNDVCLKFCQQNFDLWKRQTAPRTSHETVDPPEPAERLSSRNSDSSIEGLSNADLASELNSTGELGRLGDPALGV